MIIKIDIFWFNDDNLYSIVAWEVVDEAREGVRVVSVSNQLLDNDYRLSVVRDC